MSARPVPGARPLDARKLAAARLWASTRMPYLASALFACGIRSEPRSGTIGVDRTWQVRADPAVVDELSVEQIGRLLVHLSGHLIRDHAGRAQGLGVAEDNARGRWNRATDAEINDDLTAGDCVPDLAPDLPSDLGCETGGLAEAYYEHAREGPRRWDCGSGADGSGRAGEGEGGIDAQQAELLRLGVAAEIKRAAAREPGTVAGGWLRWAETVLPSRIDWRRVLAAEIRSAVAAVAGKVDYSYRRPSRRAHLSPDVVLPTLHRPVPDVAIVCDTSASMHDRLLARALAEVEGVLARAGLRQAQVRVLAVDTDVQTARRVSRAAQVELAGGGGTNMGAGIDAAAALRPKPAIVIVLTDGFTPWPVRPPAGIRVVVGVLGEGKGPPSCPPPEWTRTVLIEESRSPSSPRGRESAG
ncbi:MAG TPA: VWA-like domain-containing protein [Solirubrobacteraceae bacterium]|jgi:predicted metal-dependent peptidase|nr:VWA-like domain-containing protein [Solirubrobacteraceae bacterium]